jgi:hypothetical protein
LIYVLEIKRIQEENRKKKTQIGAEKRKIEAKVDEATQTSQNSEPKLIFCRPQMFVTSLTGNFCGP